MPGIHRQTDCVSSHSCPPYGPQGSGQSSACAIGVGNVLINGLPCCVMGCITTIHDCIDSEGNHGPHPGIYIRPRKVFACGLPVQAKGDLNNCGAVCVDGSSNVFVRK